GNVENPFPQPRSEALDRARLRRVLAIEGMVALEVALDWRRMRPTGLVHDGDDLRLRKDDAVWIAERDLRGDHLLAGDDDPLGGEARLLGDAERAPRMRSPELVGALDVDDRDVRAHRLHVHEPVGRRKAWIRAEDVASKQGPGRKARHVPCRGPQRKRDGEVGVVVHLERARNPLLARAAVTMSESFRDVAHPRRGDATGAAVTDQLAEQSGR